MFLVQCIWVYTWFAMNHTSLLYCQEMSKFEEPDILFNMLNCLKILCLHGECLYLARKDHPQFLAYIQEKMLIPRCAHQSASIMTDTGKRELFADMYLCACFSFTPICVFCFSLWSMLKSEFCQLASLAVPQLLHALSLSHGADIFWNLINTNFNSKDWKIRFEAGETQTLNSHSESDIFSNLSYTWCYIICRCNQWL